MKDGKDVLLTTAAEKAAFVPQIDVAHQMYNNIWPPKHPDWMSNSYLENKRNNARILRDKGHRELPDVRGARASATPAARGYRRTARASTQILDLSKAMDKFIDMLDAWADKGVAPPPTRSDWAELGDANQRRRHREPGARVPGCVLPAGRLLRLSGLDGR